MKATGCAIVLAMLALPAARAQSSLPDPQLTPGAVNPDVTQENIGQTICVRSWTHTVRPDRQYTAGLKRQGIAQYGYASHRFADYEEDHLIPIGIGGSPTDPRNLWPEPRYAPDGWTADHKDKLEAVLNRLVCRRRIPLATAQAAIAANWEEAYKRYVGGTEP